MTLTVCLQLAVTVHDSAIPRVRTTSTLTITVMRNQNPPVFTEDVYNANVNIQTKVGDVIATIKATDADGVSGKFPLCLFPPVSYTHLRAHETG